MQKTRTPPGPAAPPGARDPPHEPAAARPHGPNAEHHPAPWAWEEFLALVAEANNELRQVLQQVSGHLELAIVDLDMGNGPPPRERLYEMLVAVDRAAGVVDTHLDQARVLQSSLRLSTEDFDLKEAVEATLRRHNLLRDGGPVRLDGGPAWVAGDPAQLTAAVQLLVLYFLRRIQPNQRILARVAASGDLVEGFVGLQPSHIPLEHLAREFGLRTPAASADAMAVARAVVEKHQGIIGVTRGWQNTVGFQFTLPALGARGGG